MEWMTCHYWTVQNGNWEIGEILSSLCIIVIVNCELQCVHHHHVWLLTIAPCLVRAWFFLALGGQWTFAYLPFANPTSLYEKETSMISNNARWGGGGLDWLGKKTLNHYFKEQYIYYKQQILDVHFIAKPKNAYRRLCVVVAKAPWHKHSVDLLRPVYSSLNTQ